MALVDMVDAMDGVDPPLAAVDGVDTCLRRWTGRNRQEER